MTSNSLLKYCLFYKGEVICPPKYDGKNAGKLWKAEQFVCEELYNLVDNSKPHQSFVQYVSDYVQKWSPFRFKEIMNEYFDRDNELKSKLL